MRSKVQTAVLGAKQFKGEIEGTHFDQTTLYVVFDVSDKKGTEVGQNALPLKYGTSEEFHKVKHLFANGPIQAELELHLTTKGYEVESFRPLQAQKSSASQG